MVDELKEFAESIIRTRKELLRRPHYHNVVKAKLDKNGGGRKVSNSPNSPKVFLGGKASKSLKKGKSLGRLLMVPKIAGLLQVLPELP
jgi:hypothetical protein